MMKSRIGFLRVLMDGDTEEYALESGDKFYPLIFATDEQAEATPKNKLIALSMSAAPTHMGDYAVDAGAWWYKHVSA